MWLYCLIAFNLGLFSSLHCIGMCGGIITVLMRSTAQGEGERNVIVKNSLAYNLGRIVSYSFAGLIFGLFGSGLSELIADYNAHLLLQLVAALVLIALALNLVGVLSFSRRLEGFGMRFWKYIQPLGKGLLPVTTYNKAFMFGLLWGWLPCGLVYSALLFSMTAGSATGGMLVMFAFGLGTLPAMFSAGYFVEYLQRLAQQKQLRWFSATILICMAISLPVSSWYFAEHHAQHQHDNGMQHEHHHHH